MLFASNFVGRDRFITNFAAKTNMYPTEFVSSILFEGFLTSYDFIFQSGT